MSHLPRTQKTPLCGRSAGFTSIYPSTKMTTGLPVGLRWGSAD
jgi:hypothetical protein